MKIAVPNYFVSSVVDSKVVRRIKEVCDFLMKKGCIVDYVDINHIDKAPILYQIIAMGEASSNLARFDGIRYGLKEDSNTLEDLYKKTRSKGFGREVKRRIMVGSYILSGENAKIYYNKALQIRDDLKKSFDKVFNDYDLIIGPSSSRVAYDLNNNMDDPLKCFMDDILVMHANMGGFPSLSLPVGLIDNLPIGMQIMAKHFNEATIYKLASFIEKEFKVEEVK